MAYDASIRDLMAATGRSYKSCWCAVRSGKVAAVQPFGKGTMWQILSVSPGHPGGMRAEASLRPVNFLTRSQPAAGDVSGADTESEVIEKIR